MSQQTAERRQISAKLNWSQEQILLLVIVAVTVVFSVFLDGFLAGENLLNLVRSVSSLGILAVGMAIVVIARGMDLSLVASMGVDRKSVV